MIAMRTSSERRSMFHVASRACLFVAISLFAGAISADETERVPGAQEVARRHEANWAAIRTIRLDYTTTCDFGPNFSVGGTSPNCWLVDGTRERLTTRMREAGGGFTRTDWLVDGETVWFLHRPENADVADAKHDGHLRGWIADGPPGEALLEARPHLSRRVFYLTDASATIGQIATAWHVESGDGGVTDEGDRLIRWRATPFYPEGDPRSGSFATVYFNRDRGWLVHRVEAFLRQFGRDANDPTRPVDAAYVHETKAYRDLGDGIWIPEETFYAFLGESGPDDLTREREPRFTIRWRTTNLVVNEPIDDVEFGPIFPPGSVIRDERPGRNVLRICDAAGVPGKTYSSPEAPELFGFEILEPLGMVRTLSAASMRALAGMRLARLTTF